MVATVHTGSLSGVEALGVLVEISQARGLPGFDIVGLPEATLRESRVRVMAALSNSGYQLPDRHFIVNLAPADFRKSGASFDLAIAVALLATCGLCSANALEQTLVLGELSLDGQVRSVRGVLAQLRSARMRGLPRAIVPLGDAAWGALVPNMQVHVAQQLRQVVEFLEGVGTLELASARAGREASPPYAADGCGDLQDVIGQAAAKRALEVAAAGSHHLLMVGPPGAGKTMLASRLPSLLPEPTPDEALEIATIASVAGVEQRGEPGRERPFRAPHHTCSEVALVGGGHPIRPGEVTLAHGGVLFLDELPEFRRNAIEALRPTMESGRAVVVRARERVIMPASPLMVAAMNPCPCGFAGDPKRICRCSFDQVQRYRSRVSGPVIDRFDLHVQLPPVSVNALRTAHATRAAGASDQTASSAAVRTRVQQARGRAAERASEPSARHSGARDAAERALDEPARRLLHLSMDTLGLSLRAYTKVLRVARTVADLEGSDAVSSRHVAEAVQYRLLDRDPRCEAGPIAAAVGGKR